MFGIMSAEKKLLKGVSKLLKASARCQKWQHLALCWGLYKHCWCHLDLEDFALKSCWLGFFKNFAAPLLFLPPPHPTRELVSYQNKARAPCILEFSWGKAKTSQICTHHVYKWKVGNVKCLPHLDNCDKVALSLGGDTGEGVCLSSTIYSGLVLTLSIPRRH